MRQSSIVSVILIDLAEYRVVKDTVYILISSKEKKKKEKCEGGRDFGKRKKRIFKDTNNLHSLLYYKASVFLMEILCVSRR